MMYAMATDGARDALAPSSCTSTLSPAARASSRNARHGRNDSPLSSAPWWKHSSSDASALAADDVDTFRMRRTPSACSEGRSDASAEEPRYRKPSMMLVIVWEAMSEKTYSNFGKPSLYNQ